MGCEFTNTLPLIFVILDVKVIAKNGFIFLIVFLIGSLHFGFQKIDFFQHHLNFGGVFEIISWGKADKFILS